MTTAQNRNKELVRRLNEEAWGEGNLELVDEHVADGYVEHNPASPEPIRGPEGYKANVRMVRAAFPDMTVTTEHLIAEGDEVANHYTITGTHEGPLLGVEPTGKKVQIEGMAIIEIQDGQIVEDRGMVDLFGLMVQLGVVEPPG